MLIGFNYIIKSTYTIHGAQTFPEAVKIYKFQKEIIEKNFMEKEIVIINKSGNIIPEEMIV